MHGSRTVGEEMLREQRDVAQAVPEWRQQDVKDLQPVKKILAKRAALNRLAEVSIARGDDAHVRPLKSCAAEAPILTFLDETQDLHLRRQAHLAYLIEEQDASRCDLDLSRLRLLRARECTAFVPKQLRLEQLFGEGCAVDGDERTVLPRRRLVNEAGDDFPPSLRLAPPPRGHLARLETIRSSPRRRDSTSHQMNSSRPVSAP